MKPGDLVECVSVQGHHLTMGARYEVYECGDPIYISVTNDDGDVVQYCRERFKETDQPVVKNARQCRICGAMADEYQHLFQCRKNPGHIADFKTGIFSDCSRGD